MSLILQVKIWFQNRRSKFKKLMKQGLQDKDNPMLPSSNSNGNNNSGSPSSMTSPMMESGNGVDANGSNGQAWSPNSAGENSPQSQSNAMSPPTHGMGSPNAINSSQYEMIPVTQQMPTLTNSQSTPQHAVMKTEMTSPLPTNGTNSGGMGMGTPTGGLPSFSMAPNMGSVPLVEPIITDQAVIPYGTPIHHQHSMHHGIPPLPHHQQQQMMSSPFWYPGIDDSQMHSIQHNPQGMRTGFMK